MALHEELEALAKLKTDGVLSEEEYVQAKALLLSGEPSQQPQQPFPVQPQQPFPVQPQPPFPVQPQPKSRKGCLITGLIVAAMFVVGGYFALNLVLGWFDRVSGEFLDPLTDSLRPFDSVDGFLLPEPNMFEVDGRVFRFQTRECVMDGEIATTDYVPFELLRDNENLTLLWAVHGTDGDRPFRIYGGAARLDETASHIFAHMWYEFDLETPVYRTWTPDDPIPSETSSVALFEDRVITIAGFFGSDGRSVGEGTIDVDCS